jgi:multidrug efflux system membrane fusion protein
MHFFSFLGASVFIIWISAGLTACKKTGTEPVHGAERPRVPVTAAAVSERTIPVEVRGIGNVEAFSTINVKAEVGGQLQKVHFTEGEMVRQGQILFEIDPRPQQELIRQLEANLAKDAAQARNAQAEAARYGELFKQGIAARQQAEQFETAAAAWQATLDADRAAIENARLQLQYATIHSPITGRTGNLMVKAGNLVKANDLTLVTIHQIQPIYVSFAVPEKELPDIRTRFASGLHVKATAAGDAQPAYGKLTFIDNAVDSTTGTIRMKATFANTDQRLWPGQFADVVVTVAEHRGAVLVPSEAVQAGQKGQYVFVVAGDGKAEYRAVTVGRSFEDLVQVAGVVPGEMVVTDGQSKIVPGAPVQVVEQGAGGSAR